MKDGEVESSRGRKPTLFGLRVVMRPRRAIEHESSSGRMSSGAPAACGTGGHAVKQPQQVGNPPTSREPSLR
jgi:hypothetical protein